MSDFVLEDVKFRMIESNGIRMNIGVAGSEEGPIALLVHGWPETWYSWRHQIPALVAAGYRVVIPEMRGYGKTDAPEAVEDYDIMHLSADLVGVLDALGEKTAALISHDWGAIVAATTVLLYPDRFSSLVLMSVPYAGRGKQSMMDTWHQQYGDNFFYILYHNLPGGVAEKEYDADPYGLLSRMYLSPDSPREAPLINDPKMSAGGLIGRSGAPKGLPDWLSQEELDFYVEQFKACGFRGGVNYYRNFQRNWEITEHLSDAKIEIPTLFIAGEKDNVILGADAEKLRKLMTPYIPDLRDVVVVPNMGHWIQQEDVESTNRAMLDFLQSL